MVLLFFTLAAAAWAAWEARKAAKAGWKTVEVTEKTAKWQLRAYVSHETALAEIQDGDKLVVRLVFANFGQTPAYKLRRWASMEVRNSQSGESMLVPEQDFTKSITVVGPTARVALERKIKLEEAAIDAVKTAFDANNHAAFFWGRIEYVDIYGNRQTTNFRFKTVSRRPKGGWIMNACEEGNEAT